MTAAGSLRPALQGFFADSVAVFEAAARARGLVARRYRLGNGAFRILSAGAAAAATLDAALAHIRLPDDGPSDLDIQAWDEADGALPPAPWPADAYGHRGQIDLHADDGFDAFYQLGAETLSVLDRERRLALYHMRGPLPYWERSFPFRPIFHWALAGSTLQPVHAGAVGRPGSGVLVTGPSGAGKTTTTIACLEGGLSYAGDDYVLVDTGPQPTVHSLYNTAKFTEDALRRFPRLAQRVWNPDRVPPEKALVFGQDGFPDALVASMPIRAILVPRVTGLVETSLRRVPAAVAIRALAPTTLAHLPGGAPGTLAKLTRLCAAVPCFELAAGTDLARLPLVVADLVERLAP
ncbi:hypothetical protein EDC65_2835 [Stella humosa]|uniref:Hpr(Ser) kinase/phosphatase n=1 Tax=Stella humosa TaxID=94 RepID=A0A3N1LP31_9PROT|nr:hypothetical protein [Stella humosa]ROP90975.1 hypothetical protein EDC65_2835 [Stella humosa]BBK34675.1 hypothetical protein STHU_53090 [Stella humosa]